MRCSILGYEPLLALSAEVESRHNDGTSRLGRGERTQHWLHCAHPL